MTKQELFDIWTRYMHRNDLTADLEATYRIAADRVVGRLMFTREFTNIDAILLAAPRSLIHAGLLQFAELAQDEAQIARETRFFEDAITDYSFRTSINNTDPVMSRPYYPEDEEAADGS